MQLLIFTIDKFSSVKFNPCSLKVSTNIEVIGVTVKSSCVFIFKDVKIKSLGSFVAISVPPEISTLNGGSILITEKFPVESVIVSYNNLLS